jgi:6-phosphofructokinase
MAQTIGILTSGGDTPGLNAAIRGVGKACLSHYGMRMIGFRDGFRGLMENRTMTWRAMPCPASSPWAAPSSAPAATSPTRCR